jgi:dihydroxy-acid dehydratase
MEGGPIAAVKDGDIITIDIPDGKLNVNLSKQQLEERMVEWKAPEPRIKKGYLARYSRLVSSADKGAILE